jgi:PPOX class probable F420-dependent enzyme
MPPLTPEELAAFLEDAPIARLATHNPDGTIHCVPLYFRYAGGDFLLGTQAMTRKVRNVERDPRVTLLIDNQSPPWKGAMIYGTAALDTVDPVAKRTVIFERYMDPDDARGLASTLADSYEPAVIRVTPSRISSWDYSKPGSPHGDDDDDEADDDDTADG